MPTLGADQQKLDLIVQVAEIPVAVVKVAAMLDVFQPMALTDPYRPKDFLREIARRSEFIKPAYRRDRRLPPSGALFRLIGLVLAAAGVSEPERSDYRRQHQSLPDQRYQDHREGQEQDQIAPGEWSAGCGRKRDRQRRRERNDAAHPGKREHERMLPGRRGIRPPDPGKQPTRQIDRRKDPDETRDDDDRADDSGGNRQFEQRVLTDPGDQRARLQTRRQKNQAFDEVDQEIPEENALEAGRGADQLQPVPADVKTGGHRREDAGASEML